MNVSVLAGRISNDLEVKQAGTEHKVINFDIACDRPVKGQDGNRPVDFIPVQVWDARADFVSKYFKKGDGIIVKGSIQVKPYTDKEGKKRTSFCIRAENVEFGVGNSKHQNAEDAPAAKAETAATKKAPAATQAAAPAESIDEDDDDLPF